MSDLINRAEAIHMILGEPPEAHYPSWYAEKIKQLPSAQPERKTGQWIKHNESIQLLYGEARGGVKCSECGYTTHNKAHILVGCPWKYCPNCGSYNGGGA